MMAISLMAQDLSDAVYTKKWLLGYVCRILLMKDPKKGLISLEHDE
jgi:hypothetical protein